MAAYIYSFDFISFFKNQDSAVIFETSVYFPLHCFRYIFLSIFQLLFLFFWAASCTKATKLL